MIAVLMVLSGFGALGGVVGRGVWPAQVRTSSLYASGRRVRSVALPRRMRQIVRQADVPTAQVRASLTVVKLGAVGSVAIGMIYDVRVGVGLLLGAVGLPAAFVWANRHRRDRRLLDTLPDALELVARSLRSGASIVQALADASAGVPGPLSSALRQVVDDTQRGDSVGRALQRFADRSPLGEVRVAVAALRLATESGASPARALDGVSASLRDGQRLQSEIAALTSQAHASAVVLIALPFIFVAVNAAIDPSALVFLLQDRVGRLCFGLGLLLNVAGWFWMRSLVGRVRT